MRIIAATTGALLVFFGIGFASLFVADHITEGGHVVGQLIGILVSLLLGTIAGVSSFRATMKQMRK
jgi:cytochrome c biogenesis protein CcdA